jgi:CheY-like chemotaxis protein
MEESILNNKNILAVDDEPDVLRALDEEIMWVAPKCKFEKATTYVEAAKKLETQSYDIVILDIMGVRGFDLLDLAVRRNLKVVILTAHALSPEALKHSFEMKARAYLPKDKLGEVIPFIEDVLKYEYLPGWNRLMKKLERYFDASWGELWKKSEEKFWKDFEKKTTSKR